MRLQAPMNDAQAIARQIAASARALAAGVVERMGSDEQLRTFHVGGFRELQLDTESRLLFLAEAMASGSQPLFNDHLAWTNEALLVRGVLPSYLRANLVAVLAELEERLPATASTVRRIVDAGLAFLAVAPTSTGTLLVDGARHVELAREFLRDLLEGRPRSAVQRIRDAHAAGVPATELFEDVLHVVQVEIGRMWHSGEVHVAEEHAVSRAVEQSLAALRERAERSESRGQRVLVACASGETHGIPLQFVANALDLAGYDPILLGPDTPASDLAQAASDFEVALVVLSTSIGLHVSATRDAIQGLRANPDTAQLPILVGGRPFTLDPALSDYVGADATAVTPSDAVRAANELTRRG